MQVIRHKHIPSDCNVVLTGALAVSRKCVISGVQFTNCPAIESATSNIEDGFPNVKEVEPPRSVLDHIPILEIDCFAQQSFCGRILVVEDFEGTAVLLGSL
jgi:hypothetical protein